MDGILLAPTKIFLPEENSLEAGAMNATAFVVSAYSK